MTVSRVMVLTFFLRGIACVASASPKGCDELQRSNSRCGKQRLRLLFACFPALVRGGGSSAGQFASDELLTAECEE